MKLTLFNLFELVTQTLIPPSSPYPHLTVTTDNLYLTAPTLTPPDIILLNPTYSHFILSYPVKS